MPCSIAAVTMASFASLTLRTIVLEKLLFLVPLRAIVTRKGLERGKMEGVKIRMEQSRVPAVRVEDKRVTSGPFSQNAFVRLDILISMPAKETEQTRRWKEDDRYRHSVKSRSRLKYFGDCSLFLFVQKYITRAE